MNPCGGEHEKEAGVKIKSPDQETTEKPNPLGKTRSELSGGLLLTFPTCSPLTTTITHRYVGPHHRGSQCQGAPGP